MFLTLNYTASMCIFLTSFTNLLSVDLTNAKQYILKIKIT